MDEISFTDEEDELTEYYPSEDSSSESSENEDSSSEVSEEVSYEEEYEDINSSNLDFEYDYQIIFLNKLKLSRMFILNKNISKDKFLLNKLLFDDREWLFEKIFDKVKQNYVIDIDKNIIDEYFKYKSVCKLDTIEEEDFLEKIKGLSLKRKNEENEDYKRCKMKMEYDEYEEDYDQELWRINMFLNFNIIDLDKIHSKFKLEDLENYYYDNIDDEDKYYENSEYLRMLEEYITKVSETDELFTLDENLLLVKIYFDNTIFKKNLNGEIILYDDKTKNYNFIIKDIFSYDSFVYKIYIDFMQNI